MAEAVAVVALGPADRARARHRGIARATVAGLVARGLNFLLLLLALPLAAERLSAQELGAWTLLVTATAVLGFADLGLGNGLMNVLTEALARGDERGARRVVSTGAVTLVGVAAAGAVAVAVVIPTVRWEGVLNAPAAGGLTPAVAVLLGSVLLAVPATLGQRIHVAHQEGWAASSVTALGSLAALAAATLAWAADASLPWFVAAVTGPPVVLAVLETIWVLGRSHRALRPSWGEVEPAVAAHLARAGSLFLVLAVVGAVAYHLDAVIVARALGAEAVAQFGLTARVFLVAPAALTALLMPLWPAYREALARGDHRWVAATVRRTLVGTAAVSGAVSVVLVVAAAPLVSLVTSEVTPPSIGLRLAFAAWAVVSSVSVALAMYFNAAGVVGLQVVVGSLMAASNLVLSLVLVDRVGAAGPVWASVVTQTGLVVVPELVAIRRRLRADS